MKRLPVPRPRIYDLYWYYASERQRMFERRIAAFRTFSKTATWDTVHDILSRYPTLDDLADGSFANALDTARHRQAAQRRPVHRGVHPVRHRRLRAARQAPQGLFCETDKYCREAAPELASARKRIKARFTPATEPVRLFFPPKWAVNDKLPAPPWREAREGIGGRSAPRHDDAAPTGR